MPDQEGCGTEEATLCRLASVVEVDRDEGRAGVVACPLGLVKVLEWDKSSRPLVAMHLREYELGAIAIMHRLRGERNK